MILGGGEVDDGCPAGLRCLEGESWTTAVLLVGRTTVMILGGRELDDGCVPCWMRERELNDRCGPCWMGES